jgi:pimeloyl-ACP methyl ester carboxylesterase
VLLVWGERDSSVDFQGAGIIQRLIPHAELWSVPTADHALPLERASEVAARAHEFFTRHQQSPS